MAVITISRQYGSGGDEIAQRVCKSLGYRRFDKDLMAQVASDVGLSEGEIVDLSEASFKSQNILSRLLSLLTTPTGETPTVTQTSTWQRDTSGAKVKQTEQLSEARVVAIVGQTIQAAYKLGDIVIVGRGGQAVLRDKPGVLHVRIEAPLDTRIRARDVADRRQPIGGGKADPRARQKLRRATSSASTTPTGTIPSCITWSSMPVCGE